MNHQEQIKNSRLLSWPKAEREAAVLVHEPLAAARVFGEGAAGGDPGGMPWSRWVACRRARRCRLGQIDVDALGHRLAPGWQGLQGGQPSAPNDADRIGKISTIDRVSANAEATHRSEIDPEIS